MSDKPYDQNKDDSHLGFELPPTSPARLTYEEAMRATPATGPTKILVPTPRSTFYGWLMLAPLLFLEALMVKSAWNWFFVPEFGTSEIGWAPAFALCLVLSVLTHNVYNAKSYQWADNQYEVFQIYMAGFANTLFVHLNFLFLLWVLNLITNG